MISIITITFNNYDELILTIDSLNEIDGIEHIVINGGICGKTLKYLNEEFNGISISEPDKGISDAFNKGAKLAKGRGITFLNSGDIYIGSDYYKVADDLLKNDQSIDFVHSNLLLNDPLSGELPMKPRMSSLGSGMPYFHPTMVVRKTVFEKIGDFSLEKKIAMDFDFVCRMQKCNMKGKYVNGREVVLMDGNGVSSMQEAKALLECLDSLKEHKVYGLRNFVDFGIRKLKFLVRSKLLIITPWIILKYRKIKYKKNLNKLN